MGRRRDERQSCLEDRSILEKESHKLKKISEKLSGEDSSQATFCRFCTYNFEGKPCCGF